LQPDTPPGLHPGHWVHDERSGRTGQQLYIQRNPEEDFVMSIVPPASATLIWAFPTEFEEVRCYVWEHSPAGWSIAIVFGNETLALEVAPTRWAMETGVDMVWRGLLSSGIGKFAGDGNALAALSGPEAGTASTPGSAAGSAMHHTDSSRAIPETPRMPAEISRQMPLLRPMPCGTYPRRFEDPFCPHTPFRHREPSFDADSAPSDPTPRRRLH
jgi:hypothetical protein